MRADDGAGSEPRRRSDGHRQARHHHYYTRSRLLSWFSACLLGFDRAIESALRLVAFIGYGISL